MAIEVQKVPSLDQTKSIKDYIDKKLENYVPGDAGGTQLQYIKDGENQSVVIGDIINNVATGLYSTAEGSYAQALGDSSHAEGKNTQALGYSSHAEGNSNISFGSRGHSEGDSSLASGDCSHAENSGTVTFGYASHAENKNSVAFGSH